MPRLLSFSLGALLAAALTATLGLPGDAWSQFTFRSATKNTSSGSSSTNSVELIALGASSNTIAGPANFTNDTTNPEQNVIYETFGGVAVDVCMTVQNRGQIGDVKTVVDGTETGDRIRPRRTRSRCFTAPTSIELRCTSALCDAVWRIDAI